MATIGENLTALENAKNNIKTAIEGKGQDLTGVPFTEYHDKINAIQTGGGEDMLQQMVDQSNSCYYLFANYKGANLDFIRNLDTSNATNMAYMFYYNSELTSLNLSNLKTGKVTSMQNMFASCQKLTSLNLANWDTSSVTDMSNMFNGCTKLLSVDLSNLNTSNVTTMNSMFSSCSQLTNVNLANLNTSKVTNMANMFAYCSVLPSIDVSSLNTSKVNNMEGMFRTCKELTSLDLSNFSFTYGVGMSNMFNTCEKLATIYNLDMRLASGVNNIFSNCKALTNLTLKNIQSKLTIGSGTSYGHLLTTESLINTIKELWDYSTTTGASTRTLTMATASKTNIANIYVKLVDVTDEMLANDPYANNKKPCVVCESTDEGAMTLTEYATSKKWAIA